LVLIVNLISISVLAWNQVRYYCGHLLVWIREVDDCEAINWQGKQKYSEKSCSIVALSVTNPTWPDVGRGRGKPATNCLSCRAVSYPTKKKRKKRTDRSEIQNLRYLTNADFHCHVSSTSPTLSRLNQFISSHSLSLRSISIIFSHKLQRAQHLSVTEERYWALSYMPLYKFLHNLQNVLLQFQIKWNYKTKKNYSHTYVLIFLLTFSQRPIIVFSYILQSLPISSFFLISTRNTRLSQFCILSIALSFIQNATFRRLDSLSVFWWNLLMWAQ
jgi:hypothetical protein